MYRIVKIESQTNFGLHTCYKIQKSFLGFWFYKQIDCAHVLDGSFIIIKDAYAFHKLEDAERVLDNLKNPFKEYHKGQRIYKTIFNCNAKDVYTTYHYLKSYGNSPSYEYSESLDYLKEIIDRRIKIKPTVSVV